MGATGVHGAAQCGRVRHDPGGCWGRALAGTRPGMCAVCGQSPGPFGSCMRAVRVCMWGVGGVGVGCTCAPVPLHHLTPVRNEFVRDRTLQPGWHAHGRGVCVVRIQIQNYLPQRGCMHHAPCTMHMHMHMRTGTVQGTTAVCTMHWYVNGMVHARTWQTNTMHVCGMCVHGCMVRAWADVHVGGACTCTCSCQLGAHARRALGKNQMEGGGLCMCEGAARTAPVPHAPRDPFCRLPLPWA